MSNLNVVFFASLHAFDWNTFKSKFSSWKRPFIKAIRNSVVSCIYNIVFDHVLIQISSPEYIIVLQSYLVYAHLFYQSQLHHLLEGMLQVNSYVCLRTLYTCISKDQRDGAGNMHASMLSCKLMHEVNTCIFMHACVISTLHIIHALTYIYCIVMVGK